ncbi:MAG: lipopolysaccharide biosynthesis protein [Parvularculaceae bacterium]
MKAIAVGLRRARQRLRGIGAERAFRARMANIGHLLAGNFGAAAVSILATGLAARALGPNEFGMLALVVVFVQGVERLVSFQTWQPMIRYGAAVDDAPARLDDFRSLVKFGVLLDAAGGVAAFTLAVVVARAGGELFGLGGGAVALVETYAVVLLFSSTGAAIGVLRLAGRFKETAYIQMASQSVRAIACAVALAVGAGLAEFVAIWTATHLLASLVVWALGAHQLARAGGLDFHRASLAGLSTRFPKIWRFSVFANLSLTVRSSTQQFDTLLVGALLDPAAAGFYHLAKRVARAANQAGQQVQTVVFPEVSKLWSKGDVAAFRRVTLQTETLLGLLCVVGAVATWFAAPAAADVFLGPEFAPVALLVSVQIVAVTFLLVGNVTRSALLSMGDDSFVLALSAATAALYFALAPLLLLTFGAVGGNVAHVAQGVVWVTALAYRFRRRLAVAPPPATSAVSD